MPELSTSGIAHTTALPEWSDNVFRVMRKNAKTTHVLLPANIVKPYETLLREAFPDPEHFVITTTRPDSHFEQQVVTVLYTDGEVKIPILVAVLFQSSGVEKRGDRAQLKVHEEAELSLEKVYRRHTRDLAAYGSINHADEPADVFVLACMGYYGSVYRSAIQPRLIAQSVEPACSPTTYPTTSGVDTWECRPLNGPKWSAQLDVLAPHFKAVLSTVATKKALELRNAGYEVNHLGHWDALYDGYFFENYLPCVIHDD